MNSLAEKNHLSVVPGTNYYQARMVFYRNQLHEQIKRANEAQERAEKLELLVENLKEQIKINRFEAERVARNIEKGEIQAPKKAGIDQIKVLVSDYTGISLQKMASRTRKREIVFARQLAQSLCYKFTSLPLGRIGEEFGGYDHTTIIHSCNTINNLCFSDPVIREGYLTLCGLLNKINNSENE